VVQPTEGYTGSGNYEPAGIVHHGSAIISGRMAVERREEYLRAVERGMDIGIYLGYEANEDEPQVVDLVSFLEWYDNQEATDVSP